MFGGLLLTHGALSESAIALSAVSQSSSWGQADTMRIELGQIFSADVNYATLTPAPTATDARTHRDPDARLVIGGSMRRAGFGDGKWAGVYPPTGERATGSNPQSVSTNVTRPRGLRIAA